MVANLFFGRLIFVFSFGEHLYEPLRLRGFFMELPKFVLSQKPIYIRIGEDIDCLQLFKNIEQEFETCFIFESLGEETTFSRYSIIGFDPEHIISARENNLVIDSNVYPVENPYIALQQIMPQQTMSRVYAGGLIGYLSYEAVNYFEPSIHVKIHEKFDQFMFGFYTDGFVFDKLTNELFYFYYNKNRSKIAKELLQKHNPLRTRLQIPPRRESFQVKFISNSLTKAKHAEIVEKVKEEIKTGNTFQCEVGFKSAYNITGDTIQIYEKLRDINPSPFMYYLKFGDKKIIGASPELLLSLRDGELITRPLAGTIKRGRTAREDQQLARELLRDPKERAEHKMIVDLHRNDMGKIARFGTVKVRELMTMKRLSHVQHISSEVSGIINAKETMFSALANNFPMGTVSGTPKIETMRIIDMNESEARGPYGGGVGHFGFNGDCTFALAIRTLFIANSYAYTQTSSGIVYDSDAEKEYEEVQRKSEAMRRVLLSLRSQ